MAKQNILIATAHPHFLRSYKQRPRREKGKNEQKVPERFADATRSHKFVS